MWPGTPLPLAASWHLLPLLHSWRGHQEWRNAHAKPQQPTSPYITHTPNACDSTQLLQALAVPHTHTSLLRQPTTHSLVPPQVHFSSAATFATIKKLRSSSAGYSIHIVLVLTYHSQNWLCGPVQGVSQREATRLVVPLAVGTPALSPHLHAPDKCIGVLIYRLARRTHL